MDLANGTGQWENMQEVLRSTIKALLDTQTEHQQQIAAQEKQMRDVQELLLRSRKSSSSLDKACREEAARASARAAENAAGLSRLREDVSAAKEDATAEANDLLTRVESKASKEHVKSCMDGKASLGEVTELRGRMDRLAKGGRIVEPTEIEGLREQALTLENRVAEVETRVRGCEAHAVRADPAAVALRIETVSSRLEELTRRVDHKASAKATERALEDKMDKSLLRTALDSKADRADLKAIEVSASSLLESSRERAAAAAALERKVAAAAAVAETATRSATAAATLERRADGHDKALARLSVEVAAGASTAAAERAKGGGGRCGCERELRRTGRRLARVEGGLSAVATASAGAAERTTRTADALEERCRKRVEGEVGTLAVAVEALAERVREWEPLPHLEAVQQLVDSRVSRAEASAKESTARAAAALAERLSTFERQVQGILSEFSHTLASRDAGASVDAAAAAAVHTLPARRRQGPLVSDDNGAGWHDAMSQASGNSRVVNERTYNTQVDPPDRDPSCRESPGAGTSPLCAERRAWQVPREAVTGPAGRRRERGRAGGHWHRAGKGGEACLAVDSPGRDETWPNRLDSAPRTTGGTGEQAGTRRTAQDARGAPASRRPAGPAALGAVGKNAIFSSSSSLSSPSPSPSCFPLRSSPALSATPQPAVHGLTGTAATATVAERAGQGGGGRSASAADSPERSAGRQARSGGGAGTVSTRSANRGRRSVGPAARRPQAGAEKAAALEASSRDHRPDRRRQETARRPRSVVLVEEEEGEGEEWAQAGAWASPGNLAGQKAKACPGRSTKGESGMAESSSREPVGEGGIASRIEELRRQKEAYREVATQALYA
eukprot:g9334.t1